MKAADKIIIILLILSSCTNEDNGSPSQTIPSNAPIIETIVATEITYNSAISGGIIRDDKGKLILEKGVCWDTLPDPTVNSFKTNKGQGADSFESSLAGLKPNTEYYYRSYASNADGIGYGNQLILKTFDSVPETLSVNIDASNTQFPFKLNIVDQIYHKDTFNNQLFYIYIERDSLPEEIDSIVFQITDFGIETGSFEVNLSNVLDMPLLFSFGIFYSSNASISTFVSEGNIHIQDMGYFYSITFSGVCEGGNNIGGLPNGSSVLFQNGNFKLNK